ncbi:unnamed protein product [Vitrella brassicaformis CCMP3155]|uniref:Uricase n=1 Tax=Vitrella brassicaformis (strain CCMP3155) TaxID=1169540 RepID=A0A0G4F7D3_VITBC|nr:unnamed protein product [Vitrella brassicaformis CCMP3155]|mmetsp:Transcript_20205/g.49030  ORF Transcript_20205/g.49030 Transcript_20205/m.49030 type:complete len:299 (-) Transcript_20205:923-1819(-)|eukprot:CEM08623.1 unnamed protein product [Vitrella brassicaformis CCMP3155]
MAEVNGRYGKTKVRVVRVRKTPPKSAGAGPWHELMEVEVETLLEGSFLEAYTHGDNGRIVPTDTVKNTTYVIAKKSNFDSIEDFGLALMRHFLSRHSHIDRVTVTLTEKLWNRLTVSGKPHEHVFSATGPEKRVATCVGSRSGPYSVTSGIEDLKLMKTTQSGFEGYIVDEYTTLPPAKDRIFCTKVDAKWTYGAPLPEGQFHLLHDKIRDSMMEVFAGPPEGGEYSPSVQETMYKMGLRAMEVCPSVQSVKLVLPNIHHFPFDIGRFGLTNQQEILYPTDDPSGLIECEVTRARARL